MDRLLRIIQAFQNLDRAKPVVTRRFIDDLIECEEGANVRIVNGVFTADKDIDIRRVRIMEIQLNRDILVLDKSWERIVLFRKKK